MKEILKMKAGEIVSVLEDAAPLHTQEDWDNSGLCIGSLDNEVSGAMLGLDCTLSLMEEAVAKGVNLIITHHPLIFRGLKNIYPEDPVGRAVMYAVSHGLTVYAAHTNMDKAPAGVNALLAGKIGLEDTEFLDESHIGLVGNLKSEIPAMDFIDSLKSNLNLKYVRTSRIPEGSLVKRVAVCGGSGSSFAEAAIASGATMLVTGDVSYHQFFCPEGFIIADIGHYESEVGIVDLFGLLLRKKFPKFAVYNSETNNNPVYYY